jgi:hypothetical protein
MARVAHAIALEVCPKALIIIPNVAIASFRHRVKRRLVTLVFL